MNWEKFLKPDWRKIFVCVVLFTWYSYVSFSCWINHTSGCSFGFPLSVTTPSYTWKFSFQHLSFILTSSPHVVLINLVFWYIISSSIFWVYRNVKITEKEKIWFSQFTRITKGKIIFSILGWVTVGSVFLHYLSGIYGGTMNFPSLLRIMSNSYELINMILFPFTLITFYFLYNLTIGFGTLFIFITRLPLNLGGIHHPSGLTTLGAIYVISALVIEWYFLSCSLVWIYNNLVRKRKAEV